MGFTGIGSGLRERKRRIKDKSKDYWPEQTGERRCHWLMCSSLELEITAVEFDMSLRRSRLDLRGEIWTRDLHGGIVSV